MLPGNPNYEIVEMKPIILTDFHRIALVAIFHQDRQKQAKKGPTKVNCQSETFDDECFKL